MPGTGNGHTGIFPGDPQHRGDLHLYPLRLYEFPDGTYVVDEKGADGLRGGRVTAIGGVPYAEVATRVRPLVPHDNPSSLRGLPTALRAHGGGARRPRDRRRPGAARVLGRRPQRPCTQRDPRTDYVACVRLCVQRPAARPLPVAAAADETDAAVPEAAREPALGRNARTWTDGLRRLQLGTAAGVLARGPHQQARCSSEGQARDRRPPPERRRRQHDVRVAPRRPPGEGRQQEGSAPRADRPGDVLGRRELRRRPRSLHEGDVLRRADGRRCRDLRRRGLGLASKERRSTFASQPATGTSARAPATGGSPSTPTARSTSPSRTSLPAATRCSQPH